MFRLSRNRMETTLYHKNTLNNSPESHPDCSEKKGKQHEKKSSMYVTGSASDGNIAYRMW